MFWNLEKTDTRSFEPKLDLNENENSMFSKQTTKNSLLRMKFFIETKLKYSYQ